MASLDPSLSSEEAAKIEAFSQKVYEECLHEEPDTVFRQQDVLDMDIIPNNDADTLMRVTQKLVDDKLFKIVRDGQIG